MASKMELFARGEWALFQPNQVSEVHRTLVKHHIDTHGEGPFEVVGVHEADELWHYLHPQMVVLLVRPGLTLNFTALFLKHRTH